MKLAMPPSRSSPRDGLGNADVGGGEVDVEGDQRQSRADHGGSGGGVGHGGAEVGGERAERVLADIGQGAQGVVCGGFVEKDRQGVTLRECAGQETGERGASVQGDIREGDKGQDIYRAETGVNAGVLSAGQYA